MINKPEGSCQLQLSVSDEAKTGRSMTAASRHPTARSTRGSAAIESRAVPASEPALKTGPEGATFRRVKERPRGRVSRKAMETRLPRGRSFRYSSFCPRGRVSRRQWRRLLVPRSVTGFESASVREDGLAERHWRPINLVTSCLRSLGPSAFEHLAFWA